MSLAITEKRPQRRPGGCAGIFFQLLEWNRKLAKKKLFSKKLLPPVRAEKRSAKKFGVEEKRPMAKLLLIANENRGGFPCVKKVETDDDLGNGKRDPGLVARLMGLESMPVFGHDKPRNALDSKFCDDGDNSRAYSRLDQDLCFEVGAQGRYDARPQKLQKTGGFLERPSVPARYSPEVSRKGAVSRTRKQQHKLTSPLKSPRLLSMSNQARLVHAASKILEPGMQSRSRNRRGISSMGSLVSVSLGSEAAMPFKGSKEPLNDSLIGSCRSCGGTIHLSQLRHCVMEPLVAQNGSSPSKLGNSSSLHRGVPDSSTRNGATLISVESKLHGQGRKHNISSEPQEVNANNASKIKNPRKSESSMAIDDIVRVHGSKFYGRRQVSKVVTEIAGTRDLGSAKGNLNSTSCTIGLKPTSKVSNSGRVRTDANALEKNVPHKRRSNSNLQTEKVRQSNPNSKQGNIKTDLFGQKERGSVYGRAIRGGYAKNDPRKVNIDGPRRISRENGTLSFALNSPMKQNLSNFVGKAALGNAGDEIDQNCRTFQSERLVFDATREKSTLRADELSNLLEEKIRELSSLNHDELGVGDTFPRRTTASILTELISALSARESIASSIYDDVEFEALDPKDSSNGDFLMQSRDHGIQNEVSDAKKNFQEITHASNIASLATVGDHSSPISIFDISFSNESISCGSFNGSIDLRGVETQIELKDIFSKAPSLHQAYDSLDSATSLIYCTSGTASICDLEIHEAISNTKVLLESILFFDSDNTLQSSANSFLLEVSARASNAIFGCTKLSSSSVGTKHLNHLKKSTFERLIERLDLRFKHLCMHGCKLWLKPSSLLKDQLVEELSEEVERWMDLAGRPLDELIEQDLSSSAIRWTSYEDEAFDTRIEIENVILQLLVDELLMDSVV